MPRTTIKKSIKKSIKKPIRVTNENRNIINTPIRGQIIRHQAHGGDQPEMVNLRKFQASIPEKITRKCQLLLQSGQIDRVYLLACDYVVNYFGHPDRTYDFQQYDHGQWVELFLDLVSAQFMRRFIEHKSK